MRKNGAQRRKGKTMRISIDGYNVEYKITGEGPRTLVILQGWGTNMGMYDSVAAMVSDRYRVVQIDLPGFGASDEPREPWAVDDFADFFLKFLDVMQIRELSLLGHSYGGRIIIKLAAREALPVRIEKIVLVDSAGIMPQRDNSQKFRVYKYKFLKRLANLRISQALCPELIEEWRSRQGSEDYRNATPVMRACLVIAVNEDLQEQLRLIKQDTLLVWGDKDTATPLSDGKRMEELIPESGLAVIPGVGHYSFLEAPETFRLILRAYLIPEDGSEK